MTLDPYADAPAGFVPWCRTLRGEQAWTVEIPGGPTALDTWTTLRDQHAETGLWPVLLGGDAQVVDQLTWRVAILSADRPGIPDAEDLPAAAELFVEWLGDPAADGYLNDVPRHLAKLVEDQDAIRSRLADRPDADAVRAIRAASVHLALVPARASWEVPGLLAWSGGEGHGVTSVQHLAVLQLWDDAYGAQLVSLGLEQLEFLVDRPPEDARGAFELAVQHYAYCPHLMENLAPAIGALAATLLGRHWLFDWS